MTIWHYQYFPINQVSRLRIWWLLQHLKHILLENNTFEKWDFGDGANKAKS